MYRNSRLMKRLYLSVTVWHLRNAYSFQLGLPSLRPSFHNGCRASILLRNIAPKATEIHEPFHDNKEEYSSDVMDSLDVVLERARKRKPSWVLHGVALLNSPLSFASWLSKLDLFFCAIALFAGSYGFGVGYVLGKWMTNPQNHNRFRKLNGDSIPLKSWQQGLLFQYWPVFLAIVLDQAFSALSV